MTRRAALGLLAAWGFAFGAPATAGEFAHLTGHYSDADLASGASPKTLPRTYLYDAQNRLVPVEEWPAELAEAKKHTGAGYCCVSGAAPGPDNEPPPDCVRVVYGKDMAANFRRLMDPAGQPIELRKLPKHKWLLFEYSADWCAPCRVEAKALEAFLEQSQHASDYIWITADVTRMLDAKAAQASAPRAPQ